MSDIDRRGFLGALGALIGGAILGGRAIEDKVLGEAPDAEMPVDQVAEKPPINVTEEVADDYSGGWVTISGTCSLPEWEVTRYPEYGCDLWFRRPSTGRDPYRYIYFDNTTNTGGTWLWDSSTT